MQFKLRLIPLAAIALMLVACGGGSSSSSSSVATSGVAVDGYIVGATVICNVPGGPNFNADAVTDINGAFTFSQGCRYPMTLIGGQSKDTGLLFKGTLSAPANAKVITPISTLITELMKTSSATFPNTLKTATEAQDLLNKSLGLPANTDLINTDPAALNGTNYANPALLKGNLIVQQLVQTTTENIAALAKTTPIANTQTIYSTVASSLASALANNLTPLNSSNTSSAVSLNSSVVTAFVASAATSVSTTATTPAEVKTALTTVTSGISGATQLANLTGANVTTLAQTYAAPATVAALTSVTATTQSNNSIATGINTIIQTTPLANVTPTILTPAITSAANSLPTVAPVPVTVVTTTTSTTTTSTAATTTTTAAATTTTTTTTTTLPANSLYLANDTISYDNGSAATSYTLTQFQTGAGIPVQWPMANTAALKFSLGVASTFTAPTQPVSAAISITDTASSAQVSAYVKGITVSQDGSNITVAIDPKTATGQVYFKSTDGTEALCTWASCGGGATNTTMSTATGAVSSLMLGQIINNAAGHLTSATAMSGKYVVTMVVTGLPLIHPNGTALGTYSVSVPTGTGSTTSTTGVGLQGYITVTNLTPTTTTTTTTAPTTTTTVASTTTTTVLPRLSLASDSITITDGTVTTPYSLAAFQSTAGITVKWPSNAATLQFTLADVSTFIPAAGRTVTAAMSIIDQTTGSNGQIKAFIDNVLLTKTTNGVTVTVLPSPSTGFYALSSDGFTAASGPFASTVAGMTNTLITGANSLGLKSLVDAVNNAGTMFPGTGKKYAVTLVVTDLDVYQAGTTLFPYATITVPTSVTGSSSKSVYGRAITGFVNLTP